jgi:hypothetical protein
MDPGGGKNKIGKKEIFCYEGEVGVAWTGFFIILKSCLRKHDGRISTCQECYNHFGGF